MIDEQRKTALVTGGAQGIGYGIARALAGEGLDLVIADIQAETDHQQAMNALRDQGIKVLYCQADISDSGDRETLISQVKNAFGRLNVLINNAGVAPKVRLDILDTTEESYERVMGINLQGPFFLTQSTANWMIEQKREKTDFEGCIINISSISSDTASIGRGEYCISKAGVSMVTRLFAVRLASLNIPVYEIQPGIIETSMTAGVKEKYDRLITEGLLLQARWGTPEDIGKAVAMMVRGDISYSTGQVIKVDGGFGIARL